MNPRSAEWTAPPGELGVLIAAELDRPAPDAAGALVAELLRTHGRAVEAVLFYGSCRRTGDAGGLLDLTVLHDGHFAYHRRIVPASFNAMLPPNVSMVTARHEGRTVRAKVAVMSLRQFGRRMRPGSLDTTVWARFCQPASLLYVRGPAARALVISAIARGIGTAALWAVRMGPPAGTPAEYWAGLFAHTYAVELRPEAAGRAAMITKAGAPWFDAVLPAALATIGIAPDQDEAGVLHPASDGRRSWPLAWPARWLAGRSLNVARLAKAAFTFDGAADYVAWKIERHQGIRLELTDFQRRHPLLAAPALLLQLRRRRAAATARLP